MVYIHFYNLPFLAYNDGHCDFMCNLKIIKKKKCPTQCRCWDARVQFSHMEGWLDEQK